MGRNKNRSVTVTRQLSQLTGLSCCSASVRSMERCTILSSVSGVWFQKRCDDRHVRKHWAPSEWDNLWQVIRQQLWMQSTSKRESVDYGIPEICSRLHKEGEYYLWNLNKTAKACYQDNGENDITRLWRTKFEERSDVLHTQFLNDGFCGMRLWGIYSCDCGAALGILLSVICCTSIPRCLSHLVRQIPRPCCSPCCRDWNFSKVKTVRRSSSYMCSTQLFPHVQTRQRQKLSARRNSTPVLSMDMNLARTESPQRC